MGSSRQEYWSGVPFPSPGESYSRVQVSNTCRATTARVPVAPAPRQPGGITQRKPPPCCGCKHPYLPDDSTWPTLLRLHLKLVQKNPPGKPHGGWKLTMFKTRSRPPRLPCVLRLRTVCNITAKGDTARNRKRHGSILRL